MDRFWLIGGRTFVEAEERTRGECGRDEVVGGPPCWDDCMLLLAVPTSTSTPAEDFRRDDMPLFGVERDEDGAEEKEGPPTPATVVMLVVVDALAPAALPALLLLTPGVDGVRSIELLAARSVRWYLSEWTLVRDCLG